MNDTVDSLIDSITHQWDIYQLHMPFDQATIFEVLKIQPTLSSQPDKIIWTPDKKGCFTVKSAYLTTLPTGSHSSNPFTKTEWLALWKLKIHARLKLLLWKIACNLLHTGD